MKQYKLLSVSLIFALLTTPALAQDRSSKDANVDHSKMSHDDHDHNNAAHHSESAPAQTSLLDIKDGTPLITAKVNGLVCDFCTQTLKKVFRKEKSVKEFDVDLDAGEILIVLYEGQSLEEEQLKKLIRKSGYSHVSTQRSGGA